MPYGVPFVKADRRAVPSHGITRPVREASYRSILTVLILGLAVLLVLPMAELIDTCGCPSGPDGAPCSLCFCCSHGRSGLAPAAEGAPIRMVARIAAAPSEPLPLLPAPGDVFHVPRPAVA